MNLCACGCGVEVKSGNMYIHGHNRRGLASYTSSGRWAMKHDRCIKCGTTESKHVGCGLCSKCHKKSRYAFKKAEKFDRWSKKYDRCRDCGRTDRPHQARGRCSTCYVNNTNRKQGKLKRNFGCWSWYYDECRSCGTTERQHTKDGLCIDCYKALERDINNLVKCPVCGTEVNKLNQHMTMRAKRCAQHFKYQHDRLQKCFNSDLSVKELSEKLNMSRHAITRLFIRYFGEDKTKLRNELTRRWCISKAAKVNFNHKNMYGTVIYHESPNQGVIRMRSKLEGLYADKLTESNIDWWYEKYRFHYINKNGLKRTYTPDFYLPESDVHVEVKSKTFLTAAMLDKIERVRNYNDITLEIVQI